MKQNHFFSFVLLAALVAATGLGVLSCTGGFVDPNDIGVDGGSDGDGGDGGGGGSGGGDVPTELVGHWWGKLPAEQDDKEWFEITSGGKFIEPQPVEPHVHNMAVSKDIIFVEEFGTIHYTINGDTMTVTSAIGDDHCETFGKIAKFWKNLKQAH